MFFNSPSRFWRFDACFRGSSFLESLDRHFWKASQLHDGRKDLPPTAKLIQSKGRQMVNGAIWLLAAVEPLGPSVLERVKKELERANFFFNQLPDEVWLAESTSAIFQIAEQPTAQYAAEFPEVRDFLNAEGERTKRQGGGRSGKLGGFSQNC